MNGTLGLVGSEDVYGISSASLIRTAETWKDNRQSNVLFKDGSLLFIKQWRGCLARCFQSKGIQLFHPFITFSSYFGTLVQQNLSCKIKTRINSTCQSSCRDCYSAARAADNISSDIRAAGVWLLLNVAVTDALFYSWRTCSFSGGVQYSTYPACCSC